MPNSNGDEVKISVIVPCYNEEESIPLFMESITKVLPGIEGVLFELIFIDDGSLDNTLNLLRQLTSNEVIPVKYISFSRNFGKEAAILAGLKMADGDLVCIMDADLQDPPELLPTMYRAIMEEDFDIIATCRISRAGEPPIRSFFANAFYWLVNKLSDIEIVNGARDFRLMKRLVVDAVLSLEEHSRFSKGIFSWVGFRTKWIKYDNVERVAGTSKWNFWRLFLYSLDGIIAFSIKPLAISSIFGIIFCIGAFVGIAFVIIQTLLFGNPVAGWASAISILLFIAGIQLFSIGILGQYLAKVYLETKKRPNFVVKERFG